MLLDAGFLLEELVRSRHSSSSKSRRTSRSYFRRITSPWLIPESTAVSWLLPRRRGGCFGRLMAVTMRRIITELLQYCRWAVQVVGRNRHSR